jgi:hypothetical protein
MQIHINPQQLKQIYSLMVQYISTEKSVATDMNIHNYCSNEMHWFFIIKSTKYYNLYFLSLYS